VIGRARILAAAERRTVIQVKDLPEDIACPGNAEIPPQ
jgi:hypothetical protein